MPDRPKLLYVTPVYPALGGNGLVMRAGAVLEALSALYETYLCVVPIYGDRPSDWDQMVARWCDPAHVAIVAPRLAIPWPPGLIDRLTRRAQPPALWQALSPDTGARIEAAFPGVAFDVVHAFRLLTGHLVVGWRRDSDGRPKRHLDLDDIESATGRRLANLYRANGEDDLAAREEAEAARYEQAERRLLPRFDRVYVCSDADRRRVESLYRPLEVAVLPNSVRLPAQPPSPPAGDPFVFLFVGTLDYYPNADAARWFCESVLPLIRAGADRPFAVDIVGADPAGRLADLRDVPEVNLIGAAPDLAPHYRDAAAVVVPLRAGGGTRIKVIEAFARRRPVVATSIGAEGIDAADGRHILVADTPGIFAARCLRLMEEPALGERLVAAASELLEERYTLEAVKRRLKELSP